MCDWRERQKHENWTKNVCVSKRRKFAFLNTVLFYLKINLFDFYSDDTLAIYTTNIYTTVMDVRFCSDDFFIFFCLPRLACSLACFFSCRTPREETEYIYVHYLPNGFCCRPENIQTLRCLLTDVILFGAFFFVFVPRFHFIAIICELTRPVFKCKLTRDS